MLIAALVSFLLMRLADAADPQSYLGPAVSAGQPVSCSVVQTSPKDDTYKCLEVRDDRPRFGVDR
jgi:hypothetical protein